MTVPERIMLSLMNEITDLSDWDSKVYEADFVEDWKKEMLERENVTQQMVDWVRDFTAMRCNFGQPH